MNMNIKGREGDVNTKQANMQLRREVSDSVATKDNIAC